MERVVEQEELHRLLEIFLRSNDRKDLLRLLIKISENYEEFDRVKDDLLYRLFENPKDNIFKIALFLNLISALYPDYRKNLTQRFSNQVINVDSIADLSPVFPDKDISILRLHNCASSESFLKEELKENPHLPGVWLRGEGGEPIMYFKRRGSLVGLGLNIGVTDNGVFVLPGVWYYIFVENNGRTVWVRNFTDLKYCKGESFILNPTRPWIECGTHLPGYFPPNIVISERDWIDFNDIAEELKRKFSLARDQLDLIF